MLSVDSTNRLNRLCLLMKQFELSNKRISCLPSGVLSANQFSMFFWPISAGGARTSRTVQKPVRCSMARVAQTLP